MLITTGANVEVRSTVSGPVGDFMPPEIGSVFKSDPDGVKVWINGETNNSLTNLEAGAIYWALATADINVPVFIDPADASQVTTSDLLFNGESIDNDAGELPQITLPDNSVTTFHFQVAGKSGDNAVVIGGYFYAVVGVDDTGAVFFIDIKPGYSANAVDMDLVTPAANKVTPEVYNLTAAFVGTTKFAVHIRQVTAVYYSPP